MKKILAALFVLFCAPAAAQNYLRDDGIFHSVVEGTTNGQVLVNTNGLLAGVSGVPIVVGGTVITGGTTTAPLFNNAGILGNGSISSIWSTFTQTGTGATSTTFDALYRTKIYTPEMFGAACNGSDAGPALQRAVNAVGSLTLGPGAVQLAPCAYTVVTPVVDSYGVRLLGANAGGTFFVFAPTSGGQIAYRVRNAGSIVASGGIEDIFFYTNDTTRIKIAIEVEDISHYTIKNVRISGSTAGLAALWGGGGSSIGLRTRGREFLWVDGLQSYAEIPIEIAKNPNSAIDADYFDIRNVTVVASSANNGITIDDGLALTRNNFSSISINGGTNCIYWINTTGIIPSDGNTLNNIGCEQGTAGGYNYVFEGNATGLIRDLTLSGFHLLDGVRNGPILRNIENLNISGSAFYQGVSPLLCMDVNSTVRGMSWRNSKFQNCSLASFSGQNLTSGAALNSGQVLPVWANYASSADDRSLTSTAIAMPGSSSGLATIVPQAAQGTPTLNLPTGSGTLASTASSPIVLDATTGALSCPTCSTAAAISGTPPISVSGSNVISLDNAGVTYAKIQNLGALAVMGRSANSSGVGADIQATAASDAVLRESGSTIGFGTIVTGGIANNAVTLAKMATQTANTTLGNATSGAAVPTALAMPSCSTASSALNYTTSGGASAWSCNSAITASTMPTTGLTGTLQAAQEPAHTGDVTNSAGSLALTLASVASAGTTGSSTAIPVITINAKGLTTSITTAAVVAPAGTLTGATLAAGVTASSLTSLGTITSLTATTINAFTLGGTISGGGNQINNVIIGTSTPLAGFFTTASATTSITSPLHIGGSAASSTLTLQSTSGTGTTDAIIGQTASQVERFRVTTAGLFNIGPNVAPDTLLTVNNNTGASVASSAVGGTVQAHFIAPDATIGGVVADVFGAQGLYVSRHAGGTQAAKTASASGAFSFAGQFWDTAGYFTSAGIDFNTLNTQSPTDHSGYVRVRTVASGTTTYAERLRVQLGLSIGDATDPGIGGLRATGATVQLTALGNDTATVDATVCRVAATGLLVTGTGALGICLGTSGRQFKTAFAPMAAGIDDLMKINVAQNYYYRDGFGDSGARMQYGPTAQDVETVLPDLVRYNEKGEAINYDSGALLFIGLRAIQQLKAGNDNIELRLAKLEKAQARIKELEAKIEEKK